MEPEIISIEIDEHNIRRLIARHPIQTARYAAHLPSLWHDGVMYAPFTGRVVLPSDATHARPTGYYLEYRALRQPPA